ncbi:MAG: thermonuclease [Acidimicrobiaceae bacterium]|jgi:micrococcal nuclease|nr:thermonuclease [Acidimicrobiaceae bacterium]MDP7542050.1 thermonuclease family protein [Acidimicrobiales bacterium]|tara:strand:- start:1285 stop:1785 length:501 start_codon:yes stop_codon:yes gene_type:complete
MRAVLVLMGLLLGVACSSPNLSADGMGTVVEVIDGDTVIVDLAGHRETVRLLGIDTPETVHPDRPVECFGAEASARLRLLLTPGSGVIVTRDIEPRDRYGRLLAYLERLSDGLQVNMALVERGYAATLHIDPNDALLHELAAAESRARAAGLGLWTRCGGPHEPVA